MNVRDLRGWLLQQPKPETVRVEIDGEWEEVPLGKSFARLADTIAAMKPEQVRCLDRDGKVLRALRIEDEPSGKGKHAPPDMPLVVAGDPQAALLHHYATLVHRAYEFSAGVAFESLRELMERMNQRSDAIEQRLERAEARARRAQDELVEDAFTRAEELAAQAAAEGAGGQEALGQHLVNAFLSGQMQRGPAAPKTNGAANGAAKGKA